MPQRCAFGCKASDFAVHIFPKPEKYPDRFKIWVDLVGGKLETPSDYDFYKKKRICDIHFTDEYRNRYKRLNALAVPTLHLPNTSGNQQIDYKNQTEATVDIAPIAAVPAVLDTSSTRQLSEAHPAACHPPAAVSGYSFREVINTNARSNVPSFIRDHTYCLQHRNTLENIEDTAKKDKIVDNDTTAANEETVVAIADPGDGNINDDEDDVPNTPMLEAETPQELFSWQKTGTIIADDTEVVPNGNVEVPEMTLDLGDVSMYNDDQPTPTKDTGDESTEYRCNECGEIIKGFRYTCVQCCDFDLCVSCEVRAAHTAHYVLRVPGDRPYKEIQAVLAAIRHQMLSENMFLPEMITRVKEEVKDEEEALPEGAPELEPDPLEAWGLSDHDDDCHILENNPEQYNENGRPSRKRRKTVQDHLDNKQYFTPDDDSSNDNLATDSDDNFTETNDDRTLSDDDQSSNSSFDSDPIEIIDIDKVTKTHERTQQNCEQDDNETMEIRNDNDMGISTGSFTVGCGSNDDKIEMSVGRCVTLGPVTEDGSDAIELPNDNNVAIPVTRSETVRVDDDTCNPEPLKFVYIGGQKLPLKTFAHTSHSRREARSKGIGCSTGIRPRSIGIGPRGRGIGPSGIGIGPSGIGIRPSGIGIRPSGIGIIPSGIGIRPSGIGIGTHSTADSDDRTKRYKIFLPLGAQWKQLLMKMLKTKVTVQLEDVMRKKNVQKNTRINEI